MSHAPRDEVAEAARALEQYAPPAPEPDRPTRPPPTPEEEARERRFILGHPPWLLPLVLFVATVFTTTLAGGLAFSVTLMSILVAHEMGHYLVARRHGVEATLPHFIPVPPLFMLGTLGAVIAMRTDRASRNALLDIGAAGPIAGFVVAVPAMIVGIHLSTLVEVAAAQGPLTFFGDSLLTAGLVKLLRPDVVGGLDLEAHPVFIGAWAGFLVTAINLLPMGQLDGGHVAYAISPTRAPIWARRVFRALIVLGCVGLVVHGPSVVFSILALFGAEDAIPLSLFEALRPLLPWTSYAFLVWAFLGRATGLEHPPIADPTEPLTQRRKVTAAVCLVIGVLTFMPSPAWVDGIWKKPPEIQAVEPSP